MRVCVGLRDKNRSGGGDAEGEGKTNRFSSERDGFEMLIRPTVETKHTFHNDDDGDTMMDLEWRILNVMGLIGLYIFPMYKFSGTSDGSCWYDLARVMR